MGKSFCLIHGLTNFTDQSSLYCDLLDMHCNCTSTLANEEGNAFLSQNGIAVVQTSRVKLGGHHGRDFRQVSVLLRS